ncbi:MAG: HAMP domain-containing histidine kinase [Chloroflexi bacterium]|nr:HAMP domain-containing histidine kinase [Chloroflexota bacterium]
MRSLRTRLIVSHILPLLVIVPLVGIALIYVLETQVLLPNLSAELTRQASLTADLANDHPDVWRDPVTAGLFVARFSAHHQSQVMLLDPTGKLLATSDIRDVKWLGQTIELPTLPQVLAGQNSVQINYSQSADAEIAEVLVPVIGSSQRVVGIVRVTHRLGNVYDQFFRLRYLIAAILAIGLLLGAAVGLVLALDLERSLRRVTSAILGVAYGRQLTPLAEQGPEEVRQLLRAFNTLAERLRMLEAARRRLLANVVHEVGRPIGALQSAIQALLNGADQDEVFRRELLTGMEAEVQRMHPLLNNLTELHERILGTLELSCRPTALNEWLPPTLAPWREAVQAKGLDWQATIPSGLPTIEVDPDRLAQVLGNLLSNAIKYTPAGGVVSFAAGLDNGDVWLQVSDTGPGIASEEQARIFEPFYRSQRNRRFPQGLGLGLTIAQDLIAAHGGRLEVESQTGQGSHFTVRLPQRASISMSEA